MYILKACILLRLTLSSLEKNCGIGSLTCASRTCHFPNYIIGCYTYVSSTTCQ